MEFIAELVIQVVVELLARVSTAPFRPRTSPPFLIALGYGFLGALLGVISSAIWPQSAATPTGLRLTVVLVIPIIVGLAFAAIGSWRQSRHHEPAQLERFVNDWLFAFALALVRFFWAK